ncbi:MAG: hypothetical protein ACJ8CB_30970 [Ktedonobacteraceae bacterium]
MTIPFVIDNQQHKMADVLNALLRHHRGHSLDVATAYFNIGGWQFLRELPEWLVMALIYDHVS